MTDRTIIRAALLALTKQNVSPRPAPLSTRRQAAVCIGRNISAGEPVAVYYNGSGELQRIGDVPAHNGDFFIDEGNRMYDVQDGVLRIRDGLSGEIIGNTTPAFGWRVFQGGACAAYKTREEGDVWRFLFQDGEMSGEIELAQNEGFTAGFRNGVLAVVMSRGGGYQRTLETVTYTKSGIRQRELSPVGGHYGTADTVAPISFDAVGIGHDYLSGFFDIHYARYVVTTPESTSVYNPWEGYSVFYSAYVNSSELTGIRASDQAYMYGLAQLTDPQDQSVKLSEWVLLRWSIDGFDGAEETARFFAPSTNYWPPTPQGSFIRQTTEEGGTVRRLMDISTMEPLYAEDLPALPGTNLVRENTGWIWIDGCGVFRKTPLGWLMRPASSYPRSAPWGMLGYAAHSVKLGREGTAIIVFE